MRSDRNSHMHSFYYRRNDTMKKKKKKSKKKKKNSGKNWRGDVYNRDNFTNKTVLQGHDFTGALFLRGHRSKECHGQGECLSAEQLWKTLLARATEM